MSSAHRYRLIPSFTDSPAQKIAIGFQGDPVAAREPERQSDHHELVTILLFAGGGEILELEAVGDEHPHRHDLEGMNRVRHAVDDAWDRLPVAVGKEGRDLPLVHPRDRVDVQPRLALADRWRAVVPGAEFEPSAVVAGAEDQDVSLSEGNSLSLLAGFEFGPGNSLPRLEPLDPSQLGISSSTPRPTTPAW